MTLNDLKAIWRRVSDYDRTRIVLICSMAIAAVLLYLGLTFYVLEYIMGIIMLMALFYLAKAFVYDPLKQAWNEHDELVRYLEAKYPSENRKNSTGTSTESDSKQVV